jgi:hypothetical protein
MRIDLWLVGGLIATFVVVTAFLFWVAFGGGDRRRERLERAELRRAAKRAEEVRR